MANGRDDGMPPWDAAVYFQPVKLSVVSVGSTVTQLCAANPQRVGLILSQMNSSNQVAAGPSTAVVASSVGINLNQSLPPFMITQADWGNLVQAAWYAIGQIGSINVTVIEVVLQDWPGEGTPRIGTGG